MRDFEFYSPTKMIFGKSKEDTIGQHIKDFGGNRVLLHYGQSSAVKSGLIGNIKHKLENLGIEYVELPGVQPNPRLSLVRRGIQLCKEYNLDFILAVGGGSVIDSAKAIGVGAADHGDVWDFFTRERTPTASYPIGCVLTIASAGSESSNSCVVRNEEENVKRSILTDIIRPKFAILNPSLTFGLPKYHIACGISDIIMHTLDRYFTDAKDTGITDRVSEGILVTAMNYGKISLDDPYNYSARANLMWAGSLSHNTLTECGKPRDFSVHAIERGISGSYDIAHPAGLTIVWPNWARYVYKYNIMRFAEYAVNVMGCKMNFENPEATAIEGIEKTEEYFKSIDMPTSFGDANLFPTGEKMEEIAGYAVGAGDIGTFKKLNKEDIKHILSEAL